MKCEVSCPNALLNLAASLQGLDRSESQLLVNKYLQEWTHSTLGFIVPTERHEKDNNYVQIIGQTLSGEAILKEDKIIRCQLNECHVVHYDELGEELLGDLQLLLGCPVTSFMSIPIDNPSKSSSEPTISKGVDQSLHNLGQCTRKAAMIICIANKIGGKQFDANDIKMVQECLSICKGTLLATFAYEEEQRLKTQCQKLLTVARRLFSQLDDVTVLLRQIMTDARELIGAERCSLFLVDKKENQIIAKVFDGNLLPDGTVQQGPEVRLPIGLGIAGNVAITGAILNIQDAYLHPLFYKGVDEITGFKTRNILCFPIFDAVGLIAVAQLCNKSGNNKFTKFDEMMAEALSPYCGVAIHHTLMYKKVADAQFRSKLSNELMMYHMKVTEEDVGQLVARGVYRLEEIHPNFTQFTFTPRMLHPKDSAGIVYSMFHSLGMLAKWRISPETLSRFILMVQRGYRDPPYHNWMHAYSVTHFCFCTLHNLRLMETGIISELEGLALLISCLCHDVDHRGTNSQYQISSNSILASIYSSEGSVMERHHFAQAMCILNTEDCNILAELTEQEYRECLDLIRDNILATDMAHHIRIVPEMEAMIDEGYDKTNKLHRRLLMSLLMTSCDLSNQTKSWKISKQIAALIYTEFFSQGDMEKAMGTSPVESMDREKAFIPQLQLEFINNIALPTFRMLSQVLTDGGEPYQAVLKNKEHWVVAKEILTKRNIRNGSGDVLDIFKEEDFDQQVIEALNIKHEKQKE